MTRRLPPLNALRAFEAAARHLSFKNAAEELHITPAAISQQVRALEDHVGRPLFRRITRGLVLTEAGAAAAPLLTEGLDRLADGAARMQDAPQSRILTVSVAPSLAAKWLVPRLDRFRAAHPDVDIRLDATNALSTFRGDGVDVALRFGSGTYPGLQAERLMSETVFPVCSPQLLERGPPLVTPGDLAEHTLLHIQWAMESETAANWQMWLDAAGIDRVDPSRGPRFSHDSMAVQAAIEGHGVALAASTLVLDDLAAGRLVRPFPPSISEETAFGYFLVYPEDKAADPKMQAFQSWVTAEMGAPRAT
jgi:LysR family glycine cleavage system transcriptional activator